MQFLKTLFWVVLAVILVIFAANNWTPVSVLIWPDVRADTKLPVLVIGPFLLGFLPTYLIYRTSLWRLRKRIRSLEQAAQQPVFVPEPPAAAPEPQPVEQVEPVIADASDPETQSAVEPHAGGPRL